MLGLSAISLASLYFSCGIFRPNAGWMHPVISYPPILHLLCITSQSLACFTVFITCSFLFRPCLSSSQYPLQALHLHLSEAARTLIHVYLLFDFIFDLLAVLFFTVTFLFLYEFYNLYCNMLSLSHPLPVMIHTPHDNPPRCSDQCRLSGGYLSDVSLSLQKEQMK